jgi:hypothetical protein
MNTKSNITVAKYWNGTVPKLDDLGDPIGLTFYDARTIHGPWALLTPRNWAKIGVGKLGTGCGQKYEFRVDENRWLKTEG